MAGARAVQKAFKDAGMPDISVDDAARISGATDIIFNKSDILREFGKYKLFHDEELREFERWDDFTSYISDQICENRGLINNVHFSGHSERI